MQSRYDRPPQQRFDDQPKDIEYVSPALKGHESRITALIYDPASQQVCSRAIILAPSQCSCCLRCLILGRTVDEDEGKCSLSPCSHHIRQAQSLLHAHSEQLLLITLCF